MTLRSTDLIWAEWPAPANVRAFCTTRGAGVSSGPYAGLNLGTHVGDDPAAVAANRARLQAFVPGPIQWLDQVHGTAVAAYAPEQLPAADACFALAPAQPCTVMTADCLPVVVCTRAGTAVGVAHAGWRGLCAGVIEALVARIAAEARTAPQDCLAWLGPAIGPEAFEVGQDVVDAFAAAAAPTERSTTAKAFVAIGMRDKYLADIYALARLRLSRAGVTEVYGGGLCTVGDERLYSYRRDGVTGRMATVVWLD